MRSLVTLAIAAAALAATAGSGFARDEFQWCALYSGGTGGGGTNCGFYTLAQCRATISGAGGTCERNPRYLPDRPRRVRPKRAPQD